MLLVPAQRAGFNYSTTQLPQLAQPAGKAAEDHVGAGVAVVLRAFATEQTPELVLVDADPLLNSTYHVPEWFTAVGSEVPPIAGCVVGHCVS